MSRLKALLEKNTDEVTNKDIEIDADDDDLWGESKEDNNDLKALMSEEQKLMNMLELNRRKQSKLANPTRAQEPKSVERKEEPSVPPNAGELNAGEAKVEFAPMKELTSTQVQNEMNIDKETLTDLDFVPAEIEISGFTRDTLPKDWLLERSRYIPLRLTLEERKYMRLVKNTMDVSEYTDRIDILRWRNKTKRIHAQLKEICAILTGLVVACDYSAGQRLVKEKDFSDNAAFFQGAFEIFRRYKILNPEKLRTSYGKMIHILMDAVDPHMQDLMGFSPVTPVQTVYSYLKERNSLDILTADRDLILDATAEIDPFGKPRYQIDRELRHKNNAWKKLIRKYADTRQGLDEESFELCFRSISDNHSFLAWARSPVDKMIRLLKEHFNPKSSRHEKKYDLSISFGTGGARLSHSHKVHYHYVLQSLCLWREVLHEMFSLWWLAEEDLLEETNGYRLMNTGQGLNRVQSCPRVGKMMRRVLSNVKTRAGGWVGSSVVHLGDHNVPNALTFIDKYNQVPRILNPIIITLNAIDRMMLKPKIAGYIRSAFTSAQDLKLLILADFFRHGFDGSGADNFYDAGSCIDGRLTSAWNWCETISKKSFYPIFQIAGFNSFDGMFGES